MSRIKISSLFVLICFLFLIEGNAQVPEGAIAAPTNIRSDDCPCILSDHSVLFRVIAPDAANVQVDLGKIYDMQKKENGTWTVATDGSTNETKKIVEMFRSKGLNVEFASFPGGHEWQVWRKSLHDFAQRI